MSGFTKFALALVIIGALNWLLIGLFNFNLVTAIFGVNMLSRTIYIVVGLAGLWCLKLFAYRTTTIRERRAA
jgi:uncharacterized membrane protein YuzA (DUF378 family)